VGLHQALCEIQLPAMTLYITMHGHVLLIVQLLPLMIMPTGPSCHHDIVLWDMHTTLCYSSSHLCSVPPAHRAALNAALASEPATWWDGEG